VTAGADAKPAAVQRAGALTRLRRWPREALGNARWVLSDQLSGTSLARSSNAMG